MMASASHSPAQQDLIARMLEAGPAALLIVSEEGKAYIEHPYSEADMRSVNALIRKGRLVSDGGSGWPSNSYFYVLKEHKRCSATAPADGDKP